MGLDHHYFLIECGELAISLWIVATSHALVTKITHFDLLSCFHVCPRVAMCFVILLCLWETTKMEKLIFIIILCRGLQGGNK
jgi:hypothetical protein